jgi:hypothetical protein
VTTGAAGSVDLSIDFGFMLKIVIGDRLWYDANFDGLQDATEGGAAPASWHALGEFANASVTSGVSVQLCSVATNACKITLATPAGAYAFHRRDFATFLLPTTSYTVKIRVPNFNGVLTLLSSYQPTLYLVGTDQTINSKGQWTPGATQLTTTPFTSPPLGGVDLDVDFGFVPFLTIGDYIWLDSDGNGLQNEPVAAAGIAGVTIVVIQSGNIVLDSTVSLTAGAYQFNSRDNNIQPNSVYTLSIAVDLVCVSSSSRARVSLLLLISVRRLATALAIRRWCRVCRPTPLACRSRSCRRYCACCLMDRCVGG